MFNDIARAYTKNIYMKKLILPVACALIFALTACNQNSKPAGDAAQKPAADSMTGMHAMGDTTKKYTLGMVDNKKDPSCGMPLTAGLEDTAHYKGKVYGFCSKECKNEFLARPDAYIAKMK